MSQENVEIVRRSVDAFARGAGQTGTTAGDWDRALAEYSPDVEWVEMPSLGPDAATYRGHEELRAAAESWIGMWSEYDVEVVRYADAGADVVLLARERGSGGASGATVERELGEVFTVLDGTIVRVRLYGSWDEALEAAGLRE
jgi:ketosteroid isomerase-like protein